jgi:tetratricopeptide (TPR) repeat protein
MSRYALPMILALLVAAASDGRVSGQDPNKGPADKQAQAKPDPKPEAKPEVKPDAKPEAKPSGPNKGQEDLDKATEAKLTAKTLSDLGEVIKLCKNALEKGLDEENTKFAKTMLASTMIQRGTTVANAVLDGSPLDPRLNQFRRVALSDLETGVSIAPDQPEAHLLIARLNLMPGGDAKRAAKALDNCIAAKDGDSRTKSKALVTRAGMEKDTQKRLADLNEAVRLAPGDPVALRARGIVFADDGKLAPALADFEAAIKLDPDHAPTYEAKAMVLTKQQKYDEAMAALAQARKAEPKSVEPLVQQARVHALQMKLQAALHDLNQAYAMEPDNLAVLLLRAGVYQELKENDKAMADVEQALKLSPGLAPAVRFRAMLLADMGKTDQAVAEIQKFLQKNPDDETALLQLGMLYAADDRPRHAIEIYNKLLAKDADDWVALRGRGDALLSIGKQAEAIADYEKALKVQPKESGILNNLAWVLATSPDDKIRNGKRAIELATRACELTDYKAAHILSTLGAAYAETGDFETAKKWSRKAVELGRDDQKETLKKELENYEQKKPCRELQNTAEKGDKPGEKPAPKPGENPKPEEKAKPENQEPETVPDTTPIYWHSEVVNLCRVGSAHHNL